MKRLSSQRNLLERHARETSSSENECVAIIPARGGSKGILLKNIHYLAGKPLISYTIDAALKAHNVHRVIVSTDHQEIAEVAEKYGAEVVRRPDHLSGDYASSESALLHTLKYLQRTEKYVPDLCVFLQCTSPLTNSSDIDNCVKVILEQKADTALTVTPFHYFLWETDETGNSSGINHNKMFRPLRQERKDQFLETGAVYVMRVQAFLRAKHRFFGKTAMCVVPVGRSLEIDEPLDMKIADLLVRENQKKLAYDLLPKQIEALILDFDGVLTDDKVVVSENGVEAVVCNRGDGMGISQLTKLGLLVMVLSTEKNRVVEARCHKLGIECYQGISEKGHALHSLLEERRIRKEHVVYVGNDINDADCLRLVGCGVVVADAHENIKPLARIILNKCGGKGAVREVCDLIYKKMRGNRDDSKN